MKELNEEIAIKVRDTVACGLSHGLGIQKPGEMCIEAAVCYAYGLPHNDNPPCVGVAVRRFKIRLNDSKWSSPQARAKGMIGIAIAQLGSNEIDQKEFAKRVTLKTINQIISNIAKKHLPEVEEEMRLVTDLVRASELCRMVRRYAADAYAAGAAADAAAYAADAAAYAADAAAYAAAYAAYAADYAAYADGDKILIQSANICLEVLKELNSPECKYLYLLDNFKTTV
jgi:hypothetical protein